MTGRPTSAATARASAERVRDAAGGDGEPDLDHRRLEALPVLGRGDGLGVGPDHLGRARAADEPLLVQGHGQVETGLAAERGQHRVGALPIDDALQHVGRQRLHVGPVGEVRVRHDRGRVRVGEDDPVALLAQHAAGLGARVVELARLADHDRSRADDEDRFEIGPLGHQAAPASGSGSPGGSYARRRGHHQVALAAGAGHHPAELLEQVAAVVRARAGLGVVLHAARRDVPQAHPLAHAVVQVHVGDARPGRRGSPRRRRSCGSGW